MPALLTVSGVLPVPGFWQESQGIVTSWEGRLMYKLLYLNITRKPLHKPDLKNLKMPVQFMKKWVRLYSLTPCECLVGLLGTSAGLA